MDEKIIADGAEQAINRLSMLQRVSHALVVTDDVVGIGEIIVDLAMSYTDAEKASLMLIDETGELYFVTGKGRDIGPLRSEKTKIGEGIAGSVAESRTGVLVENIADHGKFSRFRHNQCRTGSFVSCPVMSRYRLFGVINVADPKAEGPFTKDDLMVLTIIANQAAIALENAFLMGQLRSQAAELAEITRKLKESDAARNEFITRISHELRTPLNHIRGSIYYLGTNEKLGKQKQREFFDIIAHGANELRSSVENLLRYLKCHENHDSRDMKPAEATTPLSISPEE